MKKIIFSLLIGAGFLLLTGCKVLTSQEKTAGNYTYNTECLGVEGDGTQTLKVWGRGRNRSDALAQARKNAVYDVIFKGIRDGSRECEMRPLLPEVNAREKYDAYFNKFFLDGGEYRLYISMKDEQWGNKILREKKEGTGTVEYSVVVIVNRPKLKSKLIADGILRQ